MKYDDSGMVNFGVIINKIINFMVNKLAVEFDVFGNSDYYSDDSDNCSDDTVHTLYIHTHSLAHSLAYPY